MAQLLEKHLVVKKRLAKAVLQFQDEFLSTDVQTGSLCQVWLPEQADGGETVLATKGLPFCVAGVGDTLALFRCISCRFSFSTDPARPEALGAPGRVFTMRQPEVSRNVQQQSREVYARASEAAQCRVHSAAVMPLYDSAARGAPIGVLEVVQTVQDLRFDAVVTTLARVLEASDLYTCDPTAPLKEMQAALEEAKGAANSCSNTPSASAEQSNQGTAGSHPAPAAGSCECADPCGDTPRRADSAGQLQPAAQPLNTSAVEAQEPGVHWAAGQQQPNDSLDRTTLELRRAVPGHQHLQQHQRQAAMQEGEAAEAGAARGEATRQPLALHSTSGATGRPALPVAPAAAPAPATLFGAAAAPRMVERNLREGEDSEDDDLSSSDADDVEEPGSSSAHQQGTGAPTMPNRRRGKGSGNPGKPGKRLKLADLQTVFGVGLKEAAARLGICPTTLKRACRRHGIQRWPRRQLLKINRALDDAAVHQSSGLPAAACAAPSNGSGSGGVAPDNRWVTMAQLAPAVSAQLATEGWWHVLGTPDGSAHGGSAALARLGSASSTGNLQDHLARLEVASFDGSVHTGGGGSMHGGGLLANAALHAGGSLHGDGQYGAAAHSNSGSLHGGCAYYDVALHASSSMPNGLRQQGLDPGGAPHSSPLLNGLAPGSSPCPPAPAHASGNEGSVHGGQFGILPRPPSRAMQIALAGHPGSGTAGGWQHGVQQFAPLSPPQALPQAVLNGLCSYSGPHVLCSGRSDLDIIRTPAFRSEALDSRVHGGMATSGESQQGLLQAPGVSLPAHPGAPPPHSPASATAASSGGLQGNSQGEGQAQDIFPGLEDLDDDIGLMDADVLDLLLAQ